MVTTTCEYKIYDRVSANGMYTQGIELVSNGFKLLQGSSYEMEGCLPKLNEAGVTYFYIAVR